MLRQIIVTIAAGSILSASLIGQERPTLAPARQAATQPQPGPRPPQPEAAREQPAAAVRPAESAGQPVNVKLEITISDQAGPGEPTRKIVTLIVADRANGSVRSNGAQTVPNEPMQPVSINVDTTPTLLRDGSIRVQFGLEYQPVRNAAASQPTVLVGRMTQINQRMVVILQDGKPLLVSQAADPGSERKTTVELRATILK